MEIYMPQDHHYYYAYTAQKKERQKYASHISSGFDLSTASPCWSIIRIVLSPFGEYGWMKFTCSAVWSLCLGVCLWTCVCVCADLLLIFSHHTSQQSMRNPDKTVRKKKINGSQKSCGEWGQTHGHPDKGGRRRQNCNVPRVIKEHFLQLM